MSAANYQFLEPIGWEDFIRDYLQFGVYNGTTTIRAYLVYWDMLSERSRKLRMGKILAEYGRSMEEFFAFLYAMAEQAKGKEDVFFERLIFYTPSCLYNFVHSVDFNDIHGLLHLENPDIAAKRMGLSADDVQKFMTETITLIQDLKDERKRGFKDIYNKLKHPFLVYSKVPTIILQGSSFGIMQKPDPDGHTTVDCVPIIVSKKEALKYLQNVMMIGGSIIFLLRYFLLSHELRSET
ncbi:MAG: hypothetical protein PHR28_00085 [candidate division Zixibacteria bacterium]|nr:hypothetical protein [candidate division Zixibacteria bacterium]